MTQEKTKRQPDRLIPFFALLLFFLPNLHVIDFLPDFIACFLLVRYFSRVADMAPYFDEATRCLKRLGWVNLLRLPALILVFSVRSKNQADYDIVVLLALVFTVGELLLSLQAAHYLFDAFFYLGERTSHTALIKPFAYTEESAHRIDPESLRHLTVLFLCVKAVASTLPEFLRLSSSSTAPGESIAHLSSSVYYPMILLFALLLATIVGVIWLARMLAYRRAVLSEGSILSAAEELLPEESRPLLQNKQKLRTLLGVFTIFTVAAFFTLDLTFSDFGGINILPQFFFAAILCLGIRRLSPYTEGGRATLIAGSVYGLLSLLTLGLTIRFVDAYGYDALLRSDKAREAYLPIKISAAVELAALLLFLFFFLRMLNSFTERETGLSPSSPRYGRTEATFHTSLKRKNLLLFFLGVLMGGTKCAEAFFRGTVKTVTVTGIGGVDKTMVVPVMEGFSIAVVLAAVLYIFCSFYVYSGFKEELRIKLSDTAETV